MPTQNPTAKQQQVLDFVADYICEWGSAPTFGEIAKHIGLTKGAVQHHLNALEARKLITRNANESRSIQIMGAK